MTGFLCALGGVCLQRKSPSRPNLATVSTVSVSSLSSMTLSSLGTVSSLSLSDSRKASSTLAVQAGTSGNPQEQRQYCPVTQYVEYDSF